MLAGMSDRAGCNNHGEVRVLLDGHMGVIEGQKADDEEGLNPCCTMDALE